MRRARRGPRADQLWRAADGSFEARVSYDYVQFFPFTVHLRFDEGDRDTPVTVIASPTEAKRTRIYRVVHRNHEVDRDQFVREYLHILERDRVVVPHIQPRTRNRWHWQRPAPVVPKIATRSSQRATLAGTTVTWVSVMGSLTAP